ncbi:MAG: DUF4439 domain-containing protein [Actinomycetota bacterium]
MTNRPSRRAFIVLGTGLAAQFARARPALAGVAAASDADDVVALNTLLATEHAVIYDLAAAGATLPAAARAAVLQHYDEHRSRRDALIVRIRELGGSPVAALAAYAEPAPAVVGGAEVVVVEAAALRAYHASITAVRDPRSRLLCAQAFVAESRHLALARSAVGLAGAPTPFVTGTQS